MSTAIRRIPMWSVVLVAALSMVALAQSITIGTTTYEGLFGEGVTVGTNWQIVSQGVSGTRPNEKGAAVGTLASPLEMDSSLSVARTALTKNNWKYEAQVQESGVATVTSGTYKVELFANGVSKGALYIIQGTSDAVNAEGATCQWDLGVDLPTGDTLYEIKVTPP